MLFFSFLSEPIEVLNFTLDSLSIGSAKTTSFVCMPIEVEFECHSAGVAHAVCYWFKLHMATEKDCTGAEREMQEVWKKRKKVEKEVENSKDQQLKDEKKEEEVKQMEEIQEGKKQEKKMDKTEETESYRNINSISQFPYCLDTGPQHNTQHPTLKGCTPSHFRQAATLLSEPRPLIPGDVITVEVSVDISFGFLCRILTD